MKTKNCKKHNLTHYPEYGKVKRGKLLGNYIQQKSKCENCPFIQIERHEVLTNKL